MPRTIIPSRPQIALMEAVGVMVVALLSDGCGSATRDTTTPTTHSPGNRVDFRFPLPNGNSIGAADLSGRWSVILFLTTYDTVSQAIVRRLDDYQRTHAPRINVLAVALEPPQNAPLVAVYQETLAVAYDVALADQDTLEGRGPFGDVRAVPALILLDRESRVVRSGTGVSALAEIEATLNEMNRGAR